VIRVLQDWNEIGEAILTLERDRLPTHATVQKNWDLRALRQLLGERPGAVALDLGCGAGEALKLLNAAGQSALYGVDLRIPLRLRFSQLKRMAVSHSLRPPFRLRRADITSLPFADESFDLAYAISVIEHGVNIRRFIAEAHRVLRPGGELFVTTDYWPTRLTTDNARAYNLPWRVFSRGDIADLIDHASRAGLDLKTRSSIPDCVHPLVRWQNQEYTFIQLLFVKTASPS
jgi:SAM-dependent methyltransferase